MNFTERIQTFIQTESLLTDGQRVLVGLSGGADSVCLLIVLRSLGYDIECAHCNFHLRGDESERDETFVRQLCEAHGIKLHVKHFDTLQYAKSQHVSIEMAARDLRYDWFRTLMAERGIQRLAVGHHSDDNVETVLLNLVRGAGLKGLCGMSARNGNTIRPLLCVTHADIVAHLDRCGQDYVTDSTNLLPDFARNKIRLAVMPILRTINAAADDNIGTCIANMNEVRKMYDYCVDEFCSAALDGPSEIDIQTVMRAPSPLSVLFEMLAPFGFNRSQIADLLRSVNTPGRLFQSATHRVCVGREQLVVEEITAEHIGPQSGVDELLPLAAVTDIECTIVARDDGFDFSRSQDFAYFDADRLEGRQLGVRTMRSGDRFRPFGMKGSKLVSDLLCDLHVPATLREQQRVLVADDEILWVVGRRAADRYKVTNETKRVMILRLVNS